MPGIEAFLQRVKQDWWLLGPLLVANALGMAFGWFYYYDVGQFNPACTPANFACPGYYAQPYWWPLVADSPNALLVFAAAVLAWRLVGKRSKWLDAAAFTLNLYVGLWTTTLFLSYPSRMGTFQLGSTNSILFVTHMGMPLQALVLLPQMRGDRWPRWAVAVMLLALAAFVWVDYWGPHLHPAPFLHNGVGDEVVGLPGDQWLARVSPWLMAGAAGLWLLLARPLQRVVPDEGRNGGDGV